MTSHQERTGHSGEASPTMARETKLVIIGKVLKPHGVRGEVCVSPFVDSISVFDSLQKVYLREHEAGPNTRPKAVGVSSFRPHKGCVLMTFEGVDQRETAEALRGHLLLARAKDLPKLEPGEVYQFELLGASVFLEDGRPLGRIKEIQSPAGREIWVIETSEGREVLFPVAEEFVLKMNLEAGSVTIAPPPGLLELYL